VKSMGGFTTETVLHVSTLMSDRPQMALHSFSFYFCHDNASVILVQKVVPKSNGL
jgi:hypothetical protein